MFNDNSFFYFAFYLDQHAPQPACPPEVVLYIPSSSNQAELEFSATCSDNSGEIIEPTCTHQQSGDFLSLDNHLETVSCSCTDGSGNQDQCTFTVQVIGTFLVLL